MSQVITVDDLQTFKTPTTLVDAVAQQVVDAMNAWVQSRTHRCFGEQLTVTERYDWGSTFFLKHQDVDPNSLVINVGYPGQQQTVLPAAGYFANTYGRVTMFWQGNGSHNVSSRYNDYLEVTYTYGQLDVPDDLKLAVLGIAGSFYNYALAGGQEVVASSVGSYRLQYAGSIRSSTGIPNPAEKTSVANWDIVDSYRTVRV